MYKIYSELRDNLGYKDSDIARETGIAKSTFSEWKNGKSTPKLDKIKKIADFFHVPVDYITKGEKLEYPNYDFDNDKLEMIELYSKLKKEQKEAVLNLLRSFAL